MPRNLPDIPPETRRQACALLRAEQAQELRADADLDECAEYRLAVCHFPEWLGFPFPVDPDRLDPER